MVSPAAALIIFTALVAHVAADCRKADPVPIDEAWLFKQGKIGFETIGAKGFTIEELTNAAKKKPAYELPFTGAQKSCWSANMVNGVQLMGVDQQYQCTYNEANQFPCVLYDKTGLFNKINDMVLKFPEKIVMTIVATDNSSYLAVDICQDGFKPYWVISATKKDAKLPEEEIHKALGITVKDIEASKQNPIRSARFFPKQGLCELPNPMDKLLNPGGGLQMPESPLPNPLAGLG